MADLTVASDRQQNGACPALDLSPDNLLASFYTSGTTGAAKPPMHSHRSLIAPVSATVKLREMWQRPSLEMLRSQIPALAGQRERLLRAAGAPQTLLSTTGWHTVTGLEVMVQGLIIGDLLVVLLRFYPRHVVELVEREVVTILTAVPMASDVMLRLEGLDEYDTSSLIICGTGAAPCPPQLACAIEGRLGCAVHIGFGATELDGGITVSSLSDCQERRTETVGRPPLGTEVKILDEAGRPMQSSQVGSWCAAARG